MSDLQEIVKTKLSARKENGWRELVATFGADAVKLAFLGITGNATAKGFGPDLSCHIANDVLFNDVNTVDIDILMRLK